MTTTVTTVTVVTVVMPVPNRIKQKKEKGSERKAAERRGTDCGRIGDGFVDNSREELNPLCRS